MKDAKELKERLLLRLDTLDLPKLGKEVERFLFYPDDLQRVLSFRRFVEQAFGY